MTNSEAVGGCDGRKACCGRPIGNFRVRTSWQNGADAMVVKFVIYCNGRAATMGVPELFHYGFWKIGNCKLTDGTRLERSGCCFTSCRASMGSSLTAFSPSFATVVEDSLPSVSHA